MKYIFSLFLLFFTSNLMASTEIRTALSEFAWEKRQLIVFTPTKDQDEYLRFNQLEKQLEQDFKERNLHTWHIVEEETVKLGSKEKPNLAEQSFRDYYKVDKGSFTIILVGYDQGAKVRINKADMKYIFSQIDQMSIRIQEMKQQTK